MFCLFSQCSVLNEKLEQLLQALHADHQASRVPPGVGPAIPEEDTLESTSEESLGESKDQLVNDIGKPSSQKASRPREIMLRANSLKKAVRQVIEEAGKGTHSQIWRGCSIPAASIASVHSAQICCPFTNKAHGMIEDNTFTKGKRVLRCI